MEFEMRELKFRGWDKNNKVWWSNYATGNALVLTQDKASGVVFQQYTGLKDKHGTEIYEGDVVRNDDGGTNTVDWLEAGFFVGGTSLYVLSEVLKQLEVIGNIYSNPELLETTK